MGDVVRLGDDFEYQLGVEMSDSVIATRYSNTGKQKEGGVTYTPELLASFVAGEIVDAFDIPREGALRVMDPACGDGALIDALVSKFSPKERKRLEILGLDTDEKALEIAAKKLTTKYPSLNLRLEKEDFTSFVLSSYGSDDLFSCEASRERFDLVIANPPYVRTQVIGAENAQKIAKIFDLSGRVDLYYPFILGISSVLDENGVAGVITSNRFMTTKSGKDIRREMLSRFNMLSVWDLGDTKIFDAAVLPSVFIAKGKAEKKSEVGSVRFSSIYETDAAPTSISKNVLEALKDSNDSVTEVSSGKKFRVRHGVLSNGGEPEGVWRIATDKTDQWLKTVENNTWDTFQRIGKIRVGVKSTADKVFLRSDWDELPGGRPELLRPLITRKCGQRYKACVPENPKHRKEILYPHEVTEKGRSAVDLSHYPVAENYLEQHRVRLESREYLIKAGRKWYEIWVPHDPGAWAQPKLVFVDISDKPIFWMDEGGGVVNGECYWLQCKKQNEKNLLWLALAVANSSFIEAFYDHRFNNKLYAGKRRFITQYVELFPLPNPDTDESIEIVDLVKEIYKKTPSIEAERLEMTLDRLVWNVFGLDCKEVSG